MSNVVNVKAKFDMLTEGKLRRYTIGKPGDNVSGAIYVRSDSEVPTSVVLEMVERRGDDK